MATDRDVNLQLVQLLGQTDRYQDMADLMKEVINASPVLNADQRNLLSISYKNIISVRRAGIRHLGTVLDRDDAKSSPHRLNQVRAFRSQVIAELDTFCNELIAIIDTRLLPAAAADPEAHVFYHKLKADYWRYIAENKDGAPRHDAATAARDAYTTALVIARSILMPWTPAYLGLVLNFSVYLYEIDGKADQAIQLAALTIEESGPQLDHNKKDALTEARTILQLLRENVVMWNTSASTVGKA
jgi:14-3-3 protein epsilon